MRALLVVAAVGAALAAAPVAGRAQDAFARFEITEAGDTSFVFPVGQHAWVRPGQYGIAVDPRRRDLLVARFRVLGVRNGMATALITGATSPVTPEHVVLISPPERPFYRQRAFWLGAVGGLLAGAGIGLAF